MGSSVICDEMVIFGIPKGEVCQKWTAVRESAKAESFAFRSQSWLVSYPGLLMVRVDADPTLVSALDEPSVSTV